jgi:hypothetical protein
MNWLKQIIYRWAHNSDLRQAKGKGISRQNHLISTSDVDSDEGLNITVRQAIGGRVVSFRHYDRQTDRISNRIYVISDDLDFERELGKMITLESMR